MRNYILIITLFFAHLVFGAELLVEAESFENKGGWVLDQQFMDLMGSPYLLAHGMGEPVAKASKEVLFPAAGNYHVYVRTFNWTSPWSEKDGPGRFRVEVAGKMLPPVLGTKGNKWEWQYAGVAKVKDLRTTVSLNDLTGFDGRCDAIFFTTNTEVTPPNSMENLALFRRRLLSIADQPEEVKPFDFVVVGGGISGMCAAVAAARLGSKVALINDRPVLGGNNSAEIRVHLGGSIELGPNKGLGRMIREFGHSRQGNAQPGENYEDYKKEKFIANEPNVTLFANYRAVKVNMKDRAIHSVVIKHIETGKELLMQAPLFSDCTGDGTIGYLAGADYRVGRESRAEFGEELAPEVADNLTMGASVQWYSVETKGKTRFPKFNYGVEFNEHNCEKVTMGEWKWETGMNRDQINDFERIRDYGLMVVYSNWSFLKNELSNNAKYSNRKLDWVAFMSGKRESRRLLGDYILKQDDIDKNVFHEDASFSASWSIDLHFPDPVNTQYFPGEEFKAATKHIYIHPYAVPYRCLYSRNVDNLLMAGRDISVTHVALGTVRVMRTTGMMGEVVGMAAYLCNKYNESPRGVYQKHLNELKELMQRGIGKTDGIPDNQRFNEQKRLMVPRGLKQ